MQKIKIRLFLLLFLMLSATIIFTHYTKSNILNPQKANTREDVFIVKLTDSGVALFKNKEIVKIYDIQASVLPGEDILLLSKGVSVGSVEEADNLAENFDG